MRGKNRSKRRCASWSVRLLRGILCYRDWCLVSNHRRPHGKPNDFRCPTPLLLSSNSSMYCRWDGGWSDCLSSRDISEYGTEHDEYRCLRITRKMSRWSMYAFASKILGLHVWCVSFSSTSVSARRVYSSNSDAYFLATRKRWLEHERLLLERSISASFPISRTTHLGHGINEENHPDTVATDHRSEEDSVMLTVTNVRDYLSSVQPTADKLTQYLRLAKKGGETHFPLQIFGINEWFTWIPGR